MQTRQRVPGRSKKEDSAKSGRVRHERRQTPRTLLYGGSFAVLYGEAGATEEGDLAQILDISKHGIAFRFFPGSLKGPQIRRIDITLPNKGILLQGLPVMVVNESADPTASSGLAANNKRIRRLGMCFEGLSGRKTRALETLIERFACGRTA